MSFSTDPDARNGFGPYTPGFRIVPYGDLTALAAAMDENVVAVLAEPIQGEAGVLVPPPGFLPGVRELCTANGVLFIADEIQSGLGRTGTTFACEHEDVVPDMYILGKALGGGIVPVSAVVSSRDVLGVFKPGQHGSTFGGNPLACAVAREVIAMLSTGEFQERSAKLGAHLHDRLNALPPSKVAVRGRGLWAGIDFTGLAAAPPASSWPSAACWPRTPTARPSGWRRRSSSARTTWTGASTRWRRWCAELRRTRRARPGPPVTTQLVFETHSTTYDNENGIATGWLPGKLSPAGRAQAAELGRRRASDGIAAVFCSDLARASQTAGIAFGGTGIPVLLDWRLRECDYGDLNGSTAAELHARRPEYVRNPYPAGESWQQAADRVARFTADLPLRWSGRRVLVIGHVATRWGLDHLLHGVPLADLAARDFAWQPGWDYTVPCRPVAAGRLSAARSGGPGCRPGRRSTGPADSPGSRPGS